MNAINIALDKNKSEASTPQKEQNKHVDEYLKQAAGFEKDRVEMAKASAKIAWKVAAASIFISILSVGAVLGLTPIKEKEPYVIEVNEGNGQVNIVQPMIDSQETTYGEVTDKYWLSTFVKNRNSYNWYTIQSQYDAVNLMATDEVSSQYNHFIQSDLSPVKIFEDYMNIDVNVDGVTFVPVSNGSVIAQVHFNREVKTKDGAMSNEYPVTEWIATITWDYKAEIKHEDERMINPLGLNVTSYREDQILK